MVADQLADRVFVWLVIVHAVRDGHLSVCRPSFCYFGDTGDLVSITFSPVYVRDILSNKTTLRIPLTPTINVWLRTFMTGQEMTFIGRNFFTNFYPI